MSQNTALPEGRAGRSPGQLVFGPRIADLPVPEAPESWEGHSELPLERKGKKVGEQQADKE